MKGILPNSASDTWRGHLLWTNLYKVVISQDGIILRNFHNWCEAAEPLFRTDNTTYDIVPVHSDANKMSTLARLLPFTQNLPDTIKTPVHKEIDFEFKGEARLDLQTAGHAKEPAGTGLFLNDCASQHKHYSTNTLIYILLLRSNYIWKKTQVATSRVRLHPDK